MPSIFELIQKTGGIDERDMFNTFNMGTGMCILVAKEDVDTAITVLWEAGERPAVIGEVIPGDEGVVIR